MSLNLLLRISKCSLTHTATRCHPLRTACSLTVCMDTHTRNTIRIRGNTSNIVTHIPCHTMACQECPLFFPVLLPPQVAMVGFIVPQRRCRLRRRWRELPVHHYILRPMLLGKHILHQELPSSLRSSVFVSHNNRVYV